MITINDKQCKIIINMASLAIFSLFLLIGFCGAEEQKITLDQLIAEAKEKNPEIKSAYNKWFAEKEKITSSKTWADPGIGLGTGSSDKQMLSISQAFPFPGKLSTKGKIADKAGNISYQNYKAKELEIISEIKKAYYGLFYINKAIQIYEENSGLIKHFSSVAEQRYAVGKTKLVEVLRAQVELSKYLNMLITLKQDRETIQAEINTLLNRPLNSFVGLPVEPENCLPLKLSIEGIENLALAKRPELLARTEDIEKSKKALRLAKMSYLPDFMAKYEQMEQGNMQSYEAMLNLTVPLYFWKQKSLVKENRYNKDSAESTYEAVKNMTLYQVKALYVKVDTSQRLVNLYETNILPQTEQALKVADIAYQGEKITFLDLIDIQRSLLSFKLEYYKYIFDYENYLAQLERLAGGEIK